MGKSLRGMRQPPGLPRASSGRTACGVEIEEGREKARKNAKEKKDEEVSAYRCCR
jgi:hypothetical protein